jgi:Meiotically up-regulated gene 113
MNAAPWQDEAFLTKRDLYLATIDDSLCKIGVSRRPKRRVRGISTTQPHKAKLVKVWPKAGLLEPTVHQILKPLRQRGEWFKCAPDFAEWICEMAISQKQETARHAALLYKQLMDCEARWERLGGIKGAEDECGAVRSALKSLEDDLHAAGFDTEGYRMRIAIRRAREQDARRRDPWGEYLNAAPTGDLRRPRPPRMTQEQRQERQLAALAQKQQRQLAAFAQERERNRKAVAALAPHQIAALRAVGTSNGHDKIDALTFDVLGRIGLLMRPKGTKTKTAWQLTDEGRAALEQHS